jgi:hypothetical protein
MNAIAFAIVAVFATQIGDHVAASEHLDAAQRHSRMSARRERQLVEIAALIVAGERERARGLSFEHTSEFPSDDEVLASFFRSPPEGT